MNSNNNILAIFIKRLLPISFIFILSFNFIGVIFPSKVSAAATVSELRTRVHKIYKLELLRSCVNNYLNWEGIEAGDGPFNSSLIQSGNLNFDGGFPVGYGIDSNDGEWDCSADNGGREDSLFALLFKNGSDTEHYTGWNSGSDPYTKLSNKNLKDVVGDDNPEYYFINRNNSRDYDLSQTEDALQGTDGGPAHGKIGDQINRSITLYQNGLSQDERDAMRYIGLIESFKASNGCNAKDVPSGVPNSKPTVTMGGKTYTIDKDSDEYIPVGANTFGAGKKNGEAISELTCGDIASVLTSLVPKYNKVFPPENGNNSEAQIPPGTGSESSADATSSDDQSCEAKGGDLGWAMCPALKIIGGALTWVDRELVKLLSIDRDKYTSDQMYKTWSQFRNIALTLLIAAMLVMVVSTALGIGVLDAYTVKKAFPRMVASVVFLLLSWYICILLIDVANGVGRGTLGIMTRPFGGQADNLLSLFNASSTGQGIQIGGGLLLAFGAIAIPGAIGILMSWMGTGLLIMAIAFLVLVARQMFIIVLILFSPIAILSWIFPGNDKLWKFWWQSFSKLLLMFPMVMALIASGRIFAGAINITQSSGAQGGLLEPLLKLTAYIIPYAFIPFTFKAAGGVFGNLVGMANDRSRGAFDRLKKGRQKGMQEIGQRMGAGTGFRGNNILSRGLNNTSSGLASGPKGLISRKHRQAVRESKLSNLGAAATKNSPIYEANKNNDMFLLAAASENLALKKIREAEDKKRTATTAEARQAAENEIEARKRALAMARAMPNRDRATKRQAALDLAATGYQLSDGIDGYNELSQISREINGNDDAAHANFMNTAQYNLKGAQRFDLAGINNGAGYDAGAGVGKASLYELANAKKQSIDAMVSSIPPGPPSQEAAIAYAELKAMQPNAKGANLKTINEHIAALEKRGVQAYMSSPSGRTDPVTGAPVTVSGRVDYDATRAAADPAYAASWRADPYAVARGWRVESRLETRGDVARGLARTYERPDPNRD